MNRQYFKLEPSEMAIFRAAAQIYAGYVAAGKVTDQNEQDLMKKAIQVSVILARNIENLIQSDGETAHGG